MSNKTKLILVLTAAAAFYLFAAAIAFHPRSVDSFWRSPIIIVAILFLSVAPIYSLCRILKRRDRFSTFAILLLIGALMSGLGYFAGGLMLPRNSPWLKEAATVNESLILASCVLFIWNGFVRRKR